MPRSSPVVAQFEFAARVRKRREELGLPAAVVSKHLGFSRNFYSAIENSRSLLATAKLPRLIKILEFVEHDAQALSALLEHARTPGWWQPYASLFDDAFVQYLGLESGASSIKSYESLGFNGLIQSHEYAHAVVASSLDLSPLAKRRSLEVRIRRQSEVLDSPNTPSLTFLMAETVLWQQFGGPVVLRKQLEHVLRLADRLSGQLDLRIRPFERTPVGLSSISTLVMLGFFEPLSSLVYRESGGPLGVTGEVGTVDRLKLHFELAFDSSVDREGSLDLIEQRVKQLAGAE